MYSHKACDLNGKQTWYFSLNVHTPVHVGCFIHTSRSDWNIHWTTCAGWRLNTTFHTSIASLAFIVSEKTFFFCWNWGKTEVFLYTFSAVESSFKESWALRYHTTTAFSITMITYCRFVSGASWILSQQKTSKSASQISVPFSKSFTATPPNKFHLRYMVPDLSPASPDVLEPAAVVLLGNIFSVGVTAGLPTPDELELLERCWVGEGRTGLMGGGRSWAPASRAERAGLKVVIISEVELLLRRMAASGSRIMMVCSGLPGSELTGFFMGSRVSRTTSGACLTVFCLSSSRSSWSAVVMVFSMSW